MIIDDGEESRKMSLSRLESAACTWTCYKKFLTCFDTNWMTLQPCTKILWASVIIGLKQLNRICQGNQPICQVGEDIAGIQVPYCKLSFSIRSPLAIWKVLYASWPFKKTTTRRFFPSSRFYRLFDLSICTSEWVSRAVFHQRPLIGKFKEQKNNKKKGKVAQLEKKRKKEEVWDDRVERWSWRSFYLMRKW